MKYSIHLTVSIFLLVLACSKATSLHAENTAPALLDNFDNAESASNGVKWVALSDTTMGGKSNMDRKIEDGKLIASGEISPARGMPGWSSLALPVSPNGVPMDASSFTGVRLRLKLNQGILAIQVATPDVTNYDYHAFTIMKKSTDFIIVDIPFSDMKPTWSAQEELNASAITSVNVVAVDMQPGKYSYELDEIGFY